MRLLWLTFGTLVLATADFLCVVHDQATNSKFDFTKWRGVQLNLNTDEWNAPKLTGNYTYTLTVCNSSWLQQMDTSLGWNYGKMDLFHTNAKNEDNPPWAFEQWYENGDSGSPCELQPRATRARIWCDNQNKALNCSLLPGAITSKCIQGDVNGICWCGFEWGPEHGKHRNGSMCTIHYSLLSYACPEAQPGGPAPAGLVVLVLFILFLVGFVGACAYNFSHGLRGWQVIPMYNICCKPRTPPGATNPFKATYSAL